MKRVDAEHRRIARTGGAGELTEITEVADPPIARAAQTVELAAQAPFAAVGSELGGEVAAIRGDNQAETRGNASSVEVEPVIPKRQPLRQPHQESLAGYFRDPARTVLAVLEAARPEDLPAADGQAQR